jgi:hypothetical protein
MSYMLLEDRGWLQNHQPLSKRSTLLKPSVSPTLTAHWFKHYLPVIKYQVLISKHMILFSPSPWQRSLAVE